MMSRTSLRRIAFVAEVACLICMVFACQETDGPRTGSNSNWLSPCSTDADCGGGECHCGVCAPTCTVDDDCADLDGGTCAQPDQPAVWTQCETTDFGQGLCLEGCQPGECPTDRMCVGESCVYLPLPTSDFCNPVAESDADTRKREEEVLELLQAMRRDGLTGCGTDIPPQVVPELRLDARLMCAARVMAQDAVTTGETTLVDSAGRDTLARMELAGYTPGWWGEALAIAPDAATTFDTMVIEACPLLVDESFTDVGVGCAQNACVLTLAAAP